MTIKLDVSDEITFKKPYNELSKLENIVISGDNVSYGIQDALIIGMTFVFETSLSGFTWDFIREQIFPYLKCLFKIKRSKDRIYVYVVDGKDEYDIDISDTFEEIDIKIPKKLEMKLKK
jgi:hypothetical protein